VLYQCAVRTESGKPEQERLIATFEPLIPEIRAISPATARLFDNCRLQEDYLTSFDRERSITPERGLPLLARSSQILGRVLDGLSAAYGPLSRRSGFGLLWAGRALWGIVEVSLPRGLWSIVTRYWLNLAYLVGTVLLLAGIFLRHPSTRMMGEQALVIAVAIDFARAVMRSVLVQRLRFRNALFVLAIALVAVGAWTVARSIAQLQPFVERQVTTVEDWGRHQAGRSQ
jgi:hypothetical protein